MTRLVSVPCLSISFLVWTIRIHILIFYLYSISTQISSCLVLVRSNHLLLGRFEAIPSIIRYISNLAYLETYLSTNNILYLFESNLFQSFSTPVVSSHFLIISVRSFHLKSISIIYSINQIFYTYTSRINSHLILVRSLSFYYDRFISISCRFR